MIETIYDIKISWSTTKDFLPKLFSPHSGIWDACHDITKSAVSQKNGKSSENDSITEWILTKTFIKRPITQTSKDSGSKDTRKNY